MGLEARGVCALVAIFGFVLVAVVGRIGLQVRRTGATGVAAGRPQTAAERIATTLYAIVGVGLVAVALAAALGHGPGAVRDVPIAIVAAALILATVAIALTFWAQVAMGDSWRIGVDHEQQTDLITRGPFRYVRNPIYSAMLAFVVAMTLLLPGVAMLVVLVAGLACVELQVRVVEEPFLEARYGSAYDRWARRTGRFVPLLGATRASA